MKKIYLLFYILLIPASILIGQVTIRLDENQLRLDQCILISEMVRFDEPVHPNDEECVKVFKQYFNPGSYSAFRLHYLPADWIRVTQAQYDEWQSYLTTNPLFLENVIYLKDKQGQQYMILQYKVDNQNFIIYQSSEFKRVGLTWKHTHMSNDVLASMLSQIGTLSSSYLSDQVDQEKGTLDLRAMESEHSRPAKEKFDRAKIFETLRTALVAKSVTNEDVQIARQHFIEHQDNEMIDYLSGRYRLSEIELTDAINSACGFELINYASSKRNEN